MNNPNTNNSFHGSSAGGGTGIPNGAPGMNPFGASVPGMNPFGASVPGMGPPNFDDAFISAKAREFIQIQGPGPFNHKAFITFLFGEFMKASSQAMANSLRVEGFAKPRPFGDFTPDQMGTFIEDSFKAYLEQWLMQPPSPFTMGASASASAGTPFRQENAGAPFGQAIAGDTSFSFRRAYSGAPTQPTIQEEKKEEKTNGLEDAPNYEGENNPLNLMDTGSDNSVFGGAEPKKDAMQCSSLASLNLQGIKDHEWLEARGFGHLQDGGASGGASGGAGGGAGGTSSSSHGAASGSSGQGGGGSSSNGFGFGTGF